MKERGGGVVTITERARVGAFGEEEVVGMGYEGGPSGYY